MGRRTTTAQGVSIASQVRKWKKTIALTALFSVFTCRSCILAMDHTGTITKANSKKSTRSKILATFRHLVRSACVLRLSVGNALSLRVAQFTWLSEIAILLQDPSAMRLVTGTTKPSCLLPCFRASTQRLGRCDRGLWCSARFQSLFFGCELTLLLRSLALQSLSPSLCWPPSPTPPSSTRP